ncbi:MAG: hypothetical protein J5824_03365 [Lachnospiraceae bacterium]|nr:hypothetical protein [Lachnospiraceae bacterium]
MASTNKCEYCGSTITSEDQTCPNCGASNPLYVVDTPRRITDPKTIEELQEYCAERGMPLLRMRFFIGQDCKEPKAFGIYKERPDEFVVYKNKADGSRAERYRGPDQAKAVSEIFSKLMQECYSRGIYPDGKPAAQNMVSNRSGSGSSGYRSGIGNLSIGKIILIVIIILFLARIIGGFATGSIVSNLFSGGSSSYSYDYGNGYNSGNNGSWWNNSDGNDSSSWWWSSDDDDDDSSSSWWSSGDDDDSSSWWSSDDDDDSWSNDSSWDDDWGNDWSDWDSGGTDWDSDW